METEKYDYAFLKRLNELDPELAGRGRNCSAVLESMLSKNTAVFPDFTDHTMLHSMNVQNFACRLMREHVSELSAEEIYCFTMGVSTHDMGMGVRQSDLDEFSRNTAMGEFRKNNPDIPLRDVVRKFHNDISACMVMKYYELFEIPDETYAKAIALIGRGHRKMDLLDEKTYPMNFRLSDGAELRLPLLAAVIRLADEIDIAADRNSAILYKDYFNEERTRNDYCHMRKHDSIKKIEVYDSEIIITATDEFPDVKDFIIESVEDLFGKLKYAVEVMEKCGTFFIDQKQIRFRYAQEETIYHV